MIVSASRRTDIPCFYSEWFMNRIRAGYVLTRNPMNRAQLSRVPLTPDIVDCVVFWTKDAKNMMKYLGELDGRGYKYYFQFTLTPYGRDIERGLRGKDEIAETFAVLSEAAGKERVVWRYDPVILNGDIGIAYHEEQFERMCVKFAGYTDTVTVSFVDAYPKLKTGLIRDITEEETARLGEFFGRTAKAYGLRAVACCEKPELVRYGIEKASCIDIKRIEKICGYPIEAAADKNQREGCGCAESVDIGAYDSCVNGCVYCYAGGGTAAAERRFASHDPNGETLAGKVSENEKITDRKIKKLRKNL